MAQISYNDYAKMSSSKEATQTNRNASPVSYFYLSDDGDEAVVRFNVRNYDDLKVTSFHRVKINDKNRYVTCLRESLNDSIASCPLCASGDKVYYKIFVTMLQYSMSEDGTTLEMKPVIWERPTAFIDKLRRYIDNYGDLRNQLFKIIRNGKKGDSATTYEIIPLGNNSLVYNENTCKADFSDLEEYDVEHSAIMINRPAEDVKVFVETGNFPLNKKSEEKKPEPKEEVRQPVAETSSVEEVRPSSGGRRYSF